MPPFFILLIETSLVASTQTPLANHNRVLCKNAVGCVYHKKAKEMHNLRAILLLTISLLMIIPEAHSEESKEVLSDSSNFVKASLIVSTPTDIIYSSLGHCAIRMECPSEQLDYCFSLETNTQPGDYLKFFNGDADAAVRAIPTEMYLAECRKEGRGVDQYEFNLTWHEKQQLWKSLDEEMMKPPHLKFNFLNTNCVMMVVIMIQNALIDESINYVEVPSYLTCDNGNGLRHLTRSTPWYQFIYITLSGAICDEYFSMEYRMTPISLPEVFGKAQIKGSNGQRSLFKGTPVSLVRQTNFPSSSPFTPRLVFSILLLLVILITWCEWKRGCKHTARITDTILLALEFIIGVLLCYTTLATSLFAAHWNWYLIPCNPLPLLLLLLFGKHKNFYKIYLLYTIILIAFIIATPLSSQLDIDHQLITAMFATRTASKYLKHKKINALPK